MRPTAVVLSPNWVSEQGHGSNTSRQSVFWSSDQQSTGAGDAHRPAAMCEVTPGLRKGAQPVPGASASLSSCSFTEAAARIWGFLQAKKKCKLLHLIGELFFCELVEEEKRLLDGNST